MSGWWRDNRLWLAALPFCVTAMVAASSYNVRDNWYRTDLHHEIAHAKTGEWVEVSDEYDDTVGTTRRTFEVRLTGLREGGTYVNDDDEPRPPPEGLRAVEAQLDWRADPDQQLRGCNLELLGTDGRRYQLDAPGICVPFETGGPAIPAPGDTERPGIPELEAPRPPTWSTRPVFLVPDDAHVTSLRLSWAAPDYVTLPAP